MQWHSRRAPAAVALVEAGVDRHESFVGRHHGVQQELAILAAHVALTDSGTAGQDVVTVDHGRARVDAVVDAEHDHGLVGHRPHRHHRAHRDRAGTEVRSGGAGAPPLLQQDPNVVNSQRRSVAGTLTDRGKVAVQLGELPPLVPGSVGESIDGVAQPPHPLTCRQSAPGRLAVWSDAAADEICRELDPLHHLQEPADQLDVATADVVDWDTRRRRALRVGRDRNTERDPVKAPGPRVRVDATQPVLAAVFGVVSPARA